VALCCEQDLRNLGTSIFFYQAEGGIRHRNVTGVQSCALPIFISEPTIRTAILQSIPNSNTISLPAPTICAIKYSAIMSKDALAASTRMGTWFKRNEVTSAKL